MARHWTVKLAASFTGDKLQRASKTPAGGVE